ncbi:MAG: T9SS type A sorting domain-containing protein [Chitinophagales bacterium]|nr:T9SS type A sorting domain-containing protein [Chitinophagales bacterium]
MKIVLVVFALGLSISHTFAQNTPPLLSSVNTPSIASGYTPGTLYNMVVNFNENSSKKVFTLKISNATNAGAVGYVTQLQSTLDTFTQSGFFHITSVDTAAMSAWTFKWTTPAAGGNITLELLGTALDLAGGQDDVVHTCNYQLTASSFGLNGSCSQTFTVGIWERAENSINMEVYPNPSTGKITISYSLHASENTLVDLLDLSGKAVKEIFKGSENYGISTHTVLTDDLVAGLYVLRVTLGSKVFYNKISVLNY